MEKPENEEDFFPWRKQGLFGKISREKMSENELINRKDANFLSKNYFASKLKILWELKTWGFSFKIVSSRQRKTPWGEKILKKKYKRKKFSNKIDDFFFGSTVSQALIIFHFLIGKSFDVKSSYLSEWIDVPKKTSRT